MLRCSRQRWRTSIALVYSVVRIVWLLGPRCPRNQSFVAMNGTVYTGKKTVLVSSHSWQIEDVSHIWTSYSPKSSKGFTANARGRGETAEAGWSACIHSCCRFLEYWHEDSSTTVCCCLNLLWVIPNTFIADMHSSDLLRHPKSLTLHILRLRLRKIARGYMLTSRSGVHVSKNYSPRFQITLPTSHTAYPKTRPSSFHPTSRTVRDSSIPWNISHR